MAPRRNARQGVVLLLILSLLVLFSLLALTFLIGATRYRHGAEAFGQNDLRGDDPAKLADVAVYQLLREPNNPYSSLWGHSLLFDLYGRDGTGGIVTNAEIFGSAADVGTRQVIRLDVLPTNFDTATFGDPSTLQDFYAGSVISLLNGPGAPQSSRVVRYVPSTDGTSPAYFYVEGFETLNGDIRNSINGLAPYTSATPARFLVNGKPFNGPGFGYSWQSGGAIDALTHISPHYAQYRATVPVWSLPHGDADESYDALDYQNMFLAKVPPGGSGIEASFHRSQLIDFVTNNATLAAQWGSLSNPPAGDYRNFRRRFVFRPMPWDHPYFTGGNPLLAASLSYGYPQWSPGVDMQPGAASVDDDGDGAADNLNLDLDGDGMNDYSTESGWPGSDDLLVNDDTLVTRLTNPGGNYSGNTAYDVDNDGDGIKDSFWLDLQIPPKTSKDGRLYKPLFAFLITDLDGRLNVNAHGSLAQTQTDYYQGSALPSDGRPYAGQDGALTFLEMHDTNGDTNPDRPAHGQGYGPAEINFRRLFPNNLTGMTQYQRLLLSRYGSDNLPGSAVEDFLGTLKAVGRPPEYASSTSTNYGSWDNPSAYFSTPDMHGWGAVALNTAGQPINRYAGRQGNFQDVTSANIGPASERANHPYEFNLVRPDGDDQPFTVAELEAVLRWRDGDAGLLPKRLYDLMTTNSATSINELSKLITTHSSYVPAPPTVPLAPDNGGTDLQVFDILYPTDVILPIATSPQPNPLANNAARIAVRMVDTDSSSPTYGQATSVTGVLRAPTLFDLMAAKVVQGHLAIAPPGTSTLLLRSNPLHIAAIQNNVNAMLAFEFRHGQKMDPNRLWGNGQDDNANRGVDEQQNFGGTVWESDTETIWGGTAAAGGASYLNDDTVFGAGKSIYHPRGREMYARHLFCLMMLMSDLDYPPLGLSTIPPGQPQIPGFMEPYIDPSVTTDQQRRELTIRRIAQWAINAVDFRDADAIMTPFEYDINPWNGWDVDGDLTTDDLAPNGDGTYHPDRRVVWGCEQPDLLLTETLAFHDRRVKDTKLDSNTNNRNSATADPNLDQWRIPQGSLFIEMYCPERNFYVDGSTGAADLKVAPRELYNVDSSGVRLDLARKAPIGSYAAGNLQYPVWRLAISEAYTRGPDADTKDGPNELINQQKRDNVSFQPNSPDQPDKMYLVPPTDPTELQDLPIERIVWFTQDSPAPAMGTAFPQWEQDRVYYNRFGVTEINAGEYLVVGPRAVTHIGVMDDQMTYPDITAAPDTPSSQIFRLVNDVSMTPTPFFTYGDFGYPRRNGIDAGVPQVKVARTIVAGADPPAAWAMANETANLLAGVPNAPNTPGVGLNISEPLRHEYYPEPTEFLEGSATANYPLRDGFYNINMSTGAVPDVPYDTDPGHTGYLPIRDDNIAQTARHGDYKTVFLQRLANPLMAWHPTLNPYVTVDWQPIDITVFNGEDREHTTSDGNAWDPDDSAPNPTDAMTARTPDDPRFGSRERIGQRDWTLTNPGAVKAGLYHTASVAFQQAEDDTRTSDYFSLNVRHSLGYLNRQIDDDPGHPNLAAPGATPIDLDDFVMSPGNVSAIGDPARPFEWLTWNNRPYASHLELMHVPASSAGRLLFEFIHRNPSSTNTNVDPYRPRDITAAPPDPNTEPYSSYRSPFGHLLNFFNTSSKVNMAGSVRGANFYQVLDFVEVPSRFVGTEKWYNPTEIRNAASTANDATRYRAPFNWLSRFSDPGRVNLNTAWDPRVWVGVSDGFPLMANNTFWTSNIQNTVTYTGGAPSPTDYPNPIRASASALMAPALPGDPLRQDPVEATLLRSADPSNAARHPLLDNPNFADYTTAPQNAAVHPRPNAYFRYQGLQRLGNLVSGQSNVFAVWVTVGYFQVDPGPAGQDPQRPDGYVLGPEIGVETGEIERHRAFYIIDRTVPAAFQPGTDHNVEQMILLRRFIE